MTDQSLGNVPVSPESNKQLSPISRHTSRLSSSPSPYPQLSSSSSDFSLPSGPSSSDDSSEASEDSVALQKDLETLGSATVVSQLPSLPSPRLIFEEPSGAIYDDALQGHDSDRLIPIPVIGNRALLFNIDHIKHLRVHHGIIGLLSGSLPLAPQQNTLLGLPLTLSIHEVLYLLYNGIGYLVDGGKAVSAFLEDLVDDDEMLDQLVALFTDDIAKQRSQRQKEYEQRLMRLGLADKITHSLDKTFFVETRDNDGHFGALRTHLDSYRASINAQKVLLSRLLRTATNAGLETIYQNFRVFNYLKLNFHHTLLPGVRFGGKFVSYPGDPLRYHSHLIVDTRDYYNEDIGMLDISNRGRLATGVKKLWLVCGQRRCKGVCLQKTNEQAHPEDSDGYRLVKELFESTGNNTHSSDVETVCFSIEWAGFG
ncbi:DEKNAAC105253 [Brettanomyces naardenensis]|uniref:tRNA-intron lyase n=1 Tax=Brettanomyces naardenensis TaxID=13370 RepID=A0A448YSZ2_BRENA|nr:DEKNAAC105253 [Brettanomyces naardenensis]